MFRGTWIFIITTCCILHSYTLYCRWENCTHICFWIVLAFIWCNHVTFLFRTANLTKDNQRLGILFSTLINVYNKMNNYCGRISGYSSNPHLQFFKLRNKLQILNFRIVIFLILAINILAKKEIINWVMHGHFCSNMQKCLLFQCFVLITQEPNDHYILTKIKIPLIIHYKGEFFYCSVCLWKMV